MILFTFRFLGHASSNLNSSTTVVGRPAFAVLTTSTLSKPIHVSEVPQQSAENAVIQTTSTSSNMNTQLLRHQFSVMRGLHSSQNPIGAPIQVERSSIFETPRNSQNSRIDSSRRMIQNSDQSCKRYQAKPTTENVSKIVQL